MPLLSPDHWLVPSIAASVLLALAAAGWVWRAARALPRGSRDGRSARTAAALFSAGVLGWLAYALPTGYATLWHADALLLLARQDALLRLPLLIGGLVWVAALLLARVLRIPGRGA